VTRALALNIPQEAVWPTLIGAGLLLVALAEPVITRVRLRFHAYRLSARLRRGHDSYFEELRELQAWQPEGATAFSIGLVGKAMLLALGGGAYAYVLFHPNSDALVPPFMLAVAVVAMGGALWQGFTIWRDAQPDPRAQIMSPAPGDAAERDRRIALWGRIGRTVGLAALSLVAALAAGEKSLELLR
jgi:hypothetical protein